MKKTARQELILTLLRGADGPLSGARLSRVCSVSRQIIVKDIAALRDTGAAIRSTPAGYVLAPAPVTCRVTCRHETQELLELELYTIVEGGGTVLDVLIEHPRYGTMKNQLMIATPQDVAQFLRDMQNGQPLCSLTDGVHVHTIQAADEETLRDIRQRLRKAGILV